MAYIATVNPWEDFVWDMLATLVKVVLLATVVLMVALMIVGELASTDPNPPGQPVTLGETIFVK